MTTSTPPAVSAADRQHLRDAVAAARAAGTILRTMFRDGVESRVKTSHRDLITEADFAAERTVLGYLEARYPSYGWHSEEAGRNDRPSPFLWVVDPLDGTANFAHGFPQFNVSIALLHEGVARVGVVYDPLRRELFTARRDAGSWLNGRRLAVSTAETLAEGMIATGFPYEPPSQRAAVAGLTAAMIEQVRAMRRAGAAALDLAYVAAGRLEAHFEFGLSLHDVAAGALMIREAGGRLDEMRLPEYKLGYIASNGRPLHDEIIALHCQHLGPLATTPSPLIA